jgi:hypothetical protein
MTAGGTQANGNSFWESLGETEVPQSSELEKGHSDAVEAAAGGPLGGQVGQGIWNGPPSAVVAAGREGNPWDELRGQMTGAYRRLERATCRHRLPQSSRERS